MVSSLAFGWEGHGFESHSVQFHRNEKSGDGKCDAWDPYWMAFMMPGRYATRNVVIVWLYTQQQGPICSHGLFLVGQRSRASSQRMGRSKE